MSDESGLPPVGTKLYGTLRKPARRVVEGEVVEDTAIAGGRLLRVDGQTYRSLSGAATALAGHARNGRFWWRTVDGRRLNEQ